MSQNHGRNSHQKRALKFKLFGNRSEARCCFCRLTLTPASATLEHIIPLAAGGSWDIRNLALSCNDCNQERGTIPFAEFKARKKTYVPRVSIHPVPASYEDGNDCPSLEHP